ncbi:MAG: tetratricopeptide repeat protein [Nitrosomonadales bacterium]|nr:tetratricopeptide repeat protein [Nitrosomonadales bacterium]
MPLKFKNNPEPQRVAGSAAVALAAQEFAQALALHQQGQFAQAQALYEQVLQVQPGHFDALHMLGTLAAQTGNYARAVALIGKALEINPRSAGASNNRGNALRHLNRHQAALLDFDQAIALKPDFAEAHNNRGNVLRNMRQYEAALKSYEQAIALKPDYADAYGNRGDMLKELRQYRAALESYDHAVTLRPGWAEIYGSRGSILYGLQQYRPALENYDKAIALKPDSARTYFDRGNVLQNLHQPQAALESYERAIALDPDYADAYNNRGVAMYDAKHYQAALESFERAIVLRPDYAEAYNNRGSALKRLKQPQAALESFDRAAALKSDYAEAHYNRGTLLQDMKQYQAALASYDKAFALSPDYAFLCGVRLHIRMLICDWSEAGEQCRQLEEKIARGEKASTPFPVLALTDSPAVQGKAAAIYVQDKHPANQALPEILKHPRREKIRIGYFSADFHNHATAYLMAELLEMHDKTNFELIAFSYGPDKNDEMRSRIVAALDRFIDVQELSDLDAALLSRDLGIDIAVDLKGYTQNSRAGIFAARAAPVQVNYLGFPGTMRAEYMDYLIADHTLIPARNVQHYSEKIVYLPDSYQVNDGKRQISDKQFTREDSGLPAMGFVFCCFNNNYKITPDTFDGWMRILQRVEGSVLWLLEDTPQAAGNLRKEADRRGVNAERLIFAQRMPLAEHLARHRLADLFLDTSPCNAHTTASDALWAGLPVLTRMGESFASRVAASLLNAIHLPELITSTQEEYEALAVELATHLGKLMAIREMLEHNRLSTALFDTPLITRHIEAAYAAMYERYQADLPPEHIVVPPRNSNR